MAYSDLSGEQMEQARRLWAEGKPLGEIADEVGCGTYDLSPWLYADELREAFAAERKSDEGAVQ